MKSKMVGGRRQITELRDQVTETVVRTGALEATWERQQLLLEEAGTHWTWMRTHPPSLKYTHTHKTED